MKEILFISGKGGTGKTSLTSSFIHLAESCIACDYDVDASNLPILMKPSKVFTCDFSAGFQARIDKDSCVSCGICAEVCHFDAVNPEYQIMPLACEGCGFCAKLCPVQAISMVSRPSGHWFQGIFDGERIMFYADLRPGEENSGKLVAQVKTTARKTASLVKQPLIIADGPPGIGCAVISSMVEVDLVILVTEPSYSGFHDLQRVYRLMSLRGIEGLLIINKHDLNPVICREIENWAAQEGIPLAGKVPFSQLIAQSIAGGEIPAAHPEIREMLFPIWEKITNHL